MLKKFEEDMGKNKPRIDVYLDSGSGSNGIVNTYTTVQFNGFNVVTHKNTSLNFNKTYGTSLSLLMKGTLNHDFDMSRNNPLGIGIDYTFISGYRFY